MIGCTVIARNFLAQARVLARSFRDHHPGARFVALVLDDPGGQVGLAEPFEVLRPADVGVDQAELARLAAVHGTAALATILKPRLVLRLLGEGDTEIVCLDGDVLVLGSLEGVVAVARAHGIALAPRGGELDGAGVFDTGLVAVCSGARAFVEWWGREAPRRERPLDLVPARFDHAVVRDPGIQAAYWNLAERGIERRDGALESGGQPLRSVHFSGFDGRRPWLLTTRQDRRPGVLLSEHPALAELCSGYAAELVASGLEGALAAGYGLGALPGGLRIDERMRRLYREALAGEGPEPPSPFDAPDAFVDWLNEPVGEGGVSRYLMALYDEIPLLAQSFPNLADGDAERYRSWADRIGRVQEGIAPQLLRASELPEAPAPSELEPGINVVGYLSAEAGTGEAARQLAGALEAASIPFATVAHRAVAARQGRAFEEDGLAAAKYDLNLVCVNPDAFWDFRRSVGPSLFAGRYTVGWWWWEVERFPESFRPALELVDELWTGSTFTARCLAEATSKRVVHVPLPFLVREPPRRSREELGLPDGFLFLFAFDFGSVARRKNPWGLVEAFRRAFAPGEGPVLVLKSIRGDLRLDELEHLRSAAAGRPDIRIADGYLDPGDMEALVAACDCYVSLHRSEGFGLTLAEAMARGKPVIATGYGGNLDFMSRETSLLVGYRLVEVGEDAAPYPPDAHWAEPDLDEAARLMRYVVEHPDEARTLGERASTSIRRTNAPEIAASAISARVAEIRAERVSAAGPTEPAAPSSLERLVAWVEQGPAIPWDAPSRFGPAGRAYRRLLQRLLRPYELRKREFETLAVETLKEQNHRLHTLERAHELERDRELS